MTTDNAAGQVTATYEFQVTMTVRSPGEAGAWSQVTSEVLDLAGASQWINNHAQEAAAIGLQPFSSAASSTAATPESAAPAGDVQAVSVAPDASGVPGELPL